MDRSLAEETLWQARAKEKLDEKLPSLQRCALGGRVKREERFDLVAQFSSSGAWVSPATGWTTLPDCRVFECVAKQLASTKVDAWPKGEVPPVFLDFFLRPEKPPRHAEPTDPDFPLPDTKSCGGAKELTKVSGRLPPEVIQKIVRASYGEFRTCYENGLRRNPNLQGRVSIRFVIQRDGHVDKVSIADNTLPDCQVARCIRDTYPKLEFPPPDGGIVTVVYPIMLEPG